MRPTLKPIVLTLLALGTTWLPTTASAEKLNTLKRGNWYCEMPGDASGPVGVVDDTEDFKILSASRYKVSEGTGTYLRQGKHVLMTSGPRRGDRYQLASSRIVRKLDKQGNLTALRCLRHSSEPPF